MDAIKKSNFFYLLFVQEHLYPLKFKMRLVWKSMAFYNGTEESSCNAERFANTDSFEAKLSFYMWEMLYNYTF